MPKMNSKVKSSCNFLNIRILDHYPSSKKCMEKLTLREMLLIPLSILWPFTMKVLEGFSKNPLPIYLARNSHAVLLGEFKLDH